MPDQGPPSKRRSVFIYAAIDEEHTHLLPGGTHVEIHNESGTVSAVTSSSQVSVSQEQTDAMKAELVKFCDGVDRIVADVQKDNGIEDLDKRECAAAAETLKTELEKKKPDAGTVWQVLDKVAKAAGAAKLAELVWEHRAVLESLLHRWTGA